MILGSVVLFIHQQLSASQGAYTSFCDISEGMSCDVVLGSAYANFLGIPVGAWALLAYVVAAGLSIYLMRAEPKDRLPAATALVGLAGAILGISLYFFFVSTFEIGVLCPMCLSMDAANVALFGVAFVLFRMVSKADQTGFSPRPLLGAAVAGTAVAILALAGAQSGAGPVGPVTADWIKSNDPRFYAYYVSQPVVEPPLDERHRKMATGAPITIVEFSDYQCPYCRSAHLGLDGIVSADPGQVQVIHRNFPLNADCNPAIQSRGHAVACEAAVASECATRQGNEKGAAFSHLLFLHQDDLPTADFEAYAKEAGLDLDSYRACVQSDDAKEAVAKDVQAGLDAGVESTPTLYINGRLIKGGFSRPEQYRYALAIERERAGATSPRGTSAP